MNANGKAKPVMVDSSTQTIAPPSQNVASSPNGNTHITASESQEQLTKISSTSVNNNCTPVGNGPLLTQLKDVTL